MDIQPTNQQSISDDQELAKVLAGVNQQADSQAVEATTPPLPPVPDDNDASSADEPKPEPETTEPETPAVDPQPATSSSPELDSIKMDALNELRPLVDKLDVSPEEKFDTYLLLLRSTDDQSLIAPAHESAKNITDEARRAQALLDIIKEIDFLSQPKQ